MRFALACPRCDYETPRIEICNEFPTEAAVKEELEFWLYENHPDYCTEGFIGDENNEK